MIIKCIKKGSSNLELKECLMLNSKKIVYKVELKTSTMKLENSFDSEITASNFYSKFEKELTLLHRN